MVIKVDGLDTSSLTELIDFRADLEKVIRDRFERGLALLHTDVVGSTARFDQYGDVAGRGLQQRHFSALGNALTPLTERYSTRRETVLLHTLRRPKTPFSLPFEPSN